MTQFPPVPGANYAARFGLVYPSGDQTGVTDTANIQKAATRGQRLAEGTFYVSNILLDTGQQLAGSGAGTVVQAVTGTSGNLVALTAPATSAQVTIRDLTLVPAQTSLVGISLDNTGFGTADPRHQLLNVYVNNAGGDAFKFGANIRSVIVHGCQQYGALGAGFNILSGATDNFFSDCLSGPSGNHGFFVQGGNNLFANNKSFFAGFNAGGAGVWGTTQAGFYVTATARNQFVGNQAQQSALHGFDFQNNLYCTFTGNESDTNSAGTGVTTGVGLNTNGNTSCVFEATSGANNASIMPGAQLYGYQVAGSQTGTLFFANTVTGSSGQFNYVSGGGYVVVDGFSAQFGGVQQMQVPAVELTVFTPQALSNGSTITVANPSYGVLPVTATGAVTGAIMAGGANGQEVVILNRSAFTITFATAGTSKVAAGTSAVIPALGWRSFIYDGASSLWSGGV